MYAKKIISAKLNKDELTTFLKGLIIDGSKIKSKHLLFDLYSWYYTAIAFIEKRPAH